MSRDLFKDMKVHEEEDDESKEYTPPEEKLVDSDLVERLADRLMQYYISEESNMSIRALQLVFSPEMEMKANFESDVHKVEPLIEPVPNNFTSQVVIDSLTSRLEERYANSSYSTVGTNYLTTVIQALYNLGYGDEFVIDIRDWPKQVYLNLLNMQADCHYSIGGCLHGRKDEPLTLRLYGDFSFCGEWARDCNFTAYGNIRHVGKSERCRFIFHQDVQYCGLYAKNCTFDLMPDATMSWVGYSGRGISRRNRLRRLNEKGEVAVIPTILLNLKHLPTLCS